MPKAHKAGILPVGKPHGEIEGQLVFQPKKGKDLPMGLMKFMNASVVKKEKAPDGAIKIPWSL